MLLDNRLTNLNASMNSNPTSKNYNEYHRQLYQNKINSEFDIATDVFDIEEEITPGQLDFTTAHVRITHVITSAMGQNLGDDFRGIIFQDINHTLGLGKRYRFDNNIWTCIFTDIYKFPTSSATVRRCNNTMNFYVDSKLVNEPCIIDYKPYRPEVDYKSEVSLQEGRLTVIVQNNQNTKTVYENQRFLFNQRAYKVGYIENYLQNNTYDQTSSPLITFYMDINMIAPNDDLTNNIADNSATITPTPSQTGYDYIISPTFDYVLQNQSQTYTIYRTNNSVQDDSTFTITASGVPDGYYLMSTTENSFTIKCLQPYDNARLTITCTNNDDGHVKTFNVQLKGLF